MIGDPLTAFERRAIKEMREARGKCTRPLRGHASAQAAIFEDYNGDMGLISYSTEVIRVDRSGWMTVSGTYSATTRKHINWFMIECFPDLGGYKTAKKLAETGDALNVTTGEILKSDTGEVVPA